MNGSLTFSDIDGLNSSVINYGLINASTGGSVTLLGEQVANHGLIAANLGSVNLAQHIEEGELNKTKLQE